ncbi:MAG TPA: carbonic anhydrase [Candidatus Babeliales bacterium]|nr:carbonic anhydrase [Candidatus Babeliales bacterium]
MPREIDKLIDGNKKFRKKFFNEKNTLFDELVSQGQKPKFMVIACCDSRVDPAIIFNCQPGELFTIRNIANLVPPCENADSYHGTSAALEFGTRFLEVKHIIVFGHTYCGGIQSLFTKQVFEKNAHGFIGKWMELARPAYDKVSTEHAHESVEKKMILCSQYALINSLNNVQSFPWIQERVDNQSLFLHAWYFDLDTGSIHIYDKHNGIWMVPTE